MDDETRTKQTLDKLAKMYLTQIGDGPQEDDVQRTEGSGGRGSAGSVGQDLNPGVPGRAAALVEELEGPQPIRLQPKVTVRSDVSRRAGDMVKENERPPLRLHREDGDIEPGYASSVQIEIADAGVDRGGDDRRGRGMRDESRDINGQDNRHLAHYVEMVLVGNLPGFAGPWLTQYAYYLAQRRGPVAILHIDGQQVDVDLVGERIVKRYGGVDGEDYSPLDEAMLAAGAYDGDDADAHAALLDQLEILATGKGGLTQPVRTWLIDLPELSNAGAAGGGGAPSLEMAKTVSNWTVLSGANDAAVVAAYRMLRQMFADDQRPGEEEHRLGVMMVGSDEVKSREAADKLRHTAECFTDQDIRMVGWQKQMVPIVMQSLGSFADDDPGAPGLWLMVSDYLIGLGECGGVDELVAAGDASDFDEQAVEDRVEMAEVEEAELVELVGMYDEMPDEMEDEAGDVKGFVEPPMDEAVEDTGEQLVEAASDEDEAAGGLDLTQFLTGGGEVLTARCPRDEHTQLMLDDKGQLHLLHHHPKASDLRTSLMQLTQTSQWVDEHLQLLSLTVPGKVIDEGARPALHVFTHEAKLAVQLIGAGQGVQFHLLQEVKVNGDKAWACTELN